MNKQSVAKRLLSLPAQIALAEDEVIAADKILRDAKDDLQAKEDELLTNGIIDGKNESIRSAQLRSYTTQERENVTGSDYALIRAKSKLSTLQNEFKALQAVAHLLGGEVA